MWSDNDIDQAFRRLNPPDPEPTPFPLDGWLRLEQELDKAVIERAVRRRLWKFFAAEVIVVALLFLGWLAWPTAPSRPAARPPQPAPGPAAAAAVTTAPARRPGPSRPARVLPSAAAPGPSPTSAAATTHSAAGPAPTPTATADMARPGRAMVAPRQPATARISAPGARPVPSWGLSIAATPTPRHPGSTATRAVITASPDTRRLQLSGTSPAIGGGAANEDSRRLSSIRPGRTKVHAPTGADAPDAPAAAEVAVRQPTGSAAHPANTVMRPRLASAAARRHERQPTAGSITTSAEPAAVAAAAPARVRRGRRLPLSGLSTADRALTEDDEARTTATAAADGSADETTSPDGPATADATAIAALAPTVARLSLTAAGLPAPLAPMAAVPANLPALVRQPRFYVGLVAAPDLSTVKFVNVERPKLNVGVVLEYRLTNRLRVSTGLLRVNKQYLARREDYDWSAYPRAATRNFSWVDGSCTVLDIPLNLRYDALVRPQARLFGSVGLSSFFMQRERYQYDYTEYNTTYVWDRTFTNESQHLFKVLNLSFGYEYRVGSHWSLQAEPYVKVPLAGVGVGKLQLTSGGVFFGVKYGF